MIQQESLEAQTVTSKKFGDVSETRKDGSSWSRLVILPGRDTVELPEPIVLFNTFKVPFKTRIEGNEFSSFCPAVGQPDYATYVIEYVPREKLIEQKSFRDFCTAFRSADMFQEEIALTFAWWLCRALDPMWIKVEFKFTPRGGQQNTVTFCQGTLPEELRG